MSLRCINATQDNLMYRIYSIALSDPIGLSQGFPARCRLSYMVFFSPKTCSCVKENGTYKKLTRKRYLRQMGLFIFLMLARDNCIL